MAISGLRDAFALRSNSSHPSIDKPLTGQRWLGLVLLAALLGILALLANMLFGAETGQMFGWLIGGLAIAGACGIGALAAGYLHIRAPRHSGLIAGAFLENYRDGILICNRQGHLLYANSAYARLIGAKATGEIRSLERLLVPFKEASQAVFRLSQAAKIGRDHSEEFRLARSLASADGFASWYQITVRPLSLYPLMDGQAKDGVDDPAAMTLWLLRDISMERMAQEKAFSELQDVINYLDESPAGFFAANKAEQITHINATLARWLGIDLANFSSGQLPLSDIIPLEELEKLRLARQGDDKPLSLSFHMKLKQAQGDILSCWLIGSSMADHSGDIRFLIVPLSSDDVLKREHGLQQGRYHQLFDRAPVALAELNEYGQVTKANAAFRYFFHNDLGVAGAGPHLSEIAEPEEGERIKTLINQILSLPAGAPASNSEIELKFGDKDDDRHMGLHICRFADPSFNGREEDNGRQDNLRASNAYALVFAVETTRQRHLEAQFAQGQKLQAIGQLAGGIAHDFNNVLTAIIGFSDLLLSNHRPSDPSFQDIMNIKQNANRAAGLVRQLLAFSRKQTLRPKELALGDVLSDLSILLDRLLGEKVDLQVIHGRDLWPIMADMNQFEQVIVNLAVNGRDAMIDGGQLTIATRNIVISDEGQERQPDRPAPGEYVCIEVTDTGHGMSEQTRQKIFEPFFSTKEVGKGTGLGLATVYGIVSQTGGHIYCHSAPNEGATFTIYLPRHKPVAGKISETEAPRGETIADLTGSASILLVEDEEAVRSFAARALSSRGYSVHQAASGTDALEVMERIDGKVDLVVSDVVMPEMDGPTLLSHLRRKWPQLKFIFVSGHAEDAFARHLQDDDPFVFLPKPFTLKQLATCVKQVLTAP